MSRRKTVKINLPVINPLIKKTFRSYIVFCEKMGRAHNWVTDWNRRDKDGAPSPKNLPSPEEAARMCVLLQTTPEEILTEQADIELVRGLLEQEREKSIKKEPAPEKSELSIGQLELIELSSKMSDDELRKFIAAMKAMLGE